MARVGLISPSATYQGELELTGAGGQPVRLLDALNTPHRLVNAATAIAQTLQLANAVRRDDTSGVVTACGPVIAIRPDSILAAYELAAEHREAKAGAVYEQRRHTQDTSRVAIWLENGCRIEASIGGGLLSLDAARPGKGDFVACIDVVLHDPRRGAPRQLAFLAVNVRRMESGALVAVATPPGPATPRG